MNLQGTFYSEYKQSNPSFHPDTFSCAEDTVAAILDNSTSSDHPGMLLGKVQSGKTRTFISILALAFDNGFDIAIVLTKNSRPLAEQTFKRLRAELSENIEDGDLEIYDIMNCPERFTRFELESKLIFVAKKQADNLKRLHRLFTDSCPEMRNLRVLIVDDEADSASIGFTKRAGQAEANTIAGQISEFRTCLTKVSFLQVTATPYSLYLQPKDVVVANVIEFKPTRPAFTKLVPVPDSYVGGGVYFGDASQSEEDTLESLIHHEVDPAEFDRLKKKDKRSYRPQEILTTPLYKGFRHALITFFAGGCIQRINGIAAGLAQKKLRYSFLVHSEAAKGSHSWQEDLAYEFVERIKSAAERSEPIFEQLVRESYDDLRRSLALDGKPIPEFPAVLESVRSAIRDEHVSIAKVNSDDDVSALLDDSGQLKLRTPLCLFIGGQVLDRGVTLSNLIGFYYGRRPKKYQQDTVLQHSRMYGYRREDLAVTRFYTSPAIRHAMQQMEEFDASLRGAIEAGGDGAVQFIRKAADGTIQPCSPNKILVSNVETLRPHKRLLPVGFQTKYKKDMGQYIETIDRLVLGNRDASNPDGAFLIPVSTARELVELAYKAFEFDEGFPDNQSALIGALAHLSANAPQEELRGRVWCVVREDRVVVRIRKTGRYTNAPDTTHKEGKVAREAAQTIPALILTKQNGRHEDGWRAGPFYWPVVLAPKKAHTAVFAPETVDDLTDDEIDDTSDDEETH